MSNEPFYLSQSALKDYEKLCPLVWKAKWIDKLPELHPEPNENSPMRRGLIFESLAIGAARGGQSVSATPNEKKSVYYQRIMDQAALCKKLLKDYGGTKVAVQKEIQTHFEHAGQTIYISGNIDVVYELKSLLRVIIDTKSTGDTDNEFGDFQFGNPDRIDVTQLVHYKLLHQLFYGKDCATQYWVFDFSPSMKNTLIDVEITDYTMEAHKDRLAKVYGEIEMNMAIDSWAPKPSYRECKDCPVQCDKARTFPDFIHITK